MSGKRGVGRVAALLGVALVGVALVTAACSGGSVTPNYSSNPPASVASTAPSSPSGSAGSSGSAAPSTPTAVPTTGPNVRPGEKPPSPPAEQNGTAGAVAFANYWTEAIDWGYATQSSALARQLYSSVCTSCQTFMKNFDGTLAAGLRFSGGRFTFDQSTVQSGVAPRNGSTVAVEVQFSVSALTVTGPNGKVVSTEAAHPAVRSVVWLRWMSTKRWTIVDWVPSAQ